MTFKRYNYSFQWFGKDPNEYVGFPTETDVMIDIDVLNSFFEMIIFDLKIKRINITENKRYER